MRPGHQRFQSRRVPAASTRVSASSASHCRRQQSRFGQMPQALRTRSVAGWSLGKMIHIHLMPRSSTNPDTKQGVRWTPKLSWPRQSAASHGDTRCNGRPGHLRRCLREAARCWRCPSLFRIDTRGLRYSRAPTNAQTRTLNHHMLSLGATARCAESSSSSTH